MNWREFVVEFVKALVWPAIVLATIVIFRGQLRTLIEKGLRRIKAGPFEAEFEALKEATGASLQLAHMELDEVQRRRALEPTQAPPSDEIPRARLATIRRTILPASPIVATRAAAATADDALQAAARYGYPPPGESWMGSGHPIYAARRSGRLGAIGVLAFEQLLELQEKLLQAPEVTPQQATDFIALVDEALSLLEVADQLRQASANGNE